MMLGAGDGSRRSAAAQFFMDDDDERTNQEKVVKMLNDATVTIDPAVKVQNLERVQYILLKQEPELLDKFIQDVVAFQNDKNGDVRKAVINFIEELVKKDVNLLPKVILNIQTLLQDNAPQVQKRCIQCVTTLYRLGLEWLAKSTSVSEDMSRVWTMLNNMKAYIINMVDSDNNALRTQIIKFVETIVLLQTHPDPDSVKRENDFSLDDVPLTLKVARRRKLEEEALTVFDLMIKFHGSSHISSANLQGCMRSLTTIAKLRPVFMRRVINALETLHLNLPPTLTKTEVSSLRKNLKIQLLGLLRHPSSIEYQHNITTLLTDLGASNSEVNKALPRADEYRKRTKKSAPEEAPASKKSRMEDVSPVAAAIIEPDASAVDITEAFILERLTPELAASLVIAGMARLPDTMPPVFSASYTPIAAAGTEGQIKHVSRLLATQLNAVGLGPGASIAKAKASVPRHAIVDDDDDEDGAVSSEPVATVLDEQGLEDDIIKGYPAKGIKLEISKPLSSDVRENLQTQAILRILNSQESAISGGVSVIRGKILASMAASFGAKVRQTILKFVLKDLRSQMNLALSWMYEEYSFMQGFTKRAPTQVDDQKYYDSNYNILICSFLNTVISNREMKDRDAILSRIVLEMPLVTDDAARILKEFSTTEVLGLDLINKIILNRPPKERMFLQVLLNNTCHQTPEIRETAISHTVDLYLRDDLRPIIEERALGYLNYLKYPRPAMELFGPELGRPFRSETWNDDCTKACLYLYLSLLPLSQELIHGLAVVYVATVPDVKRTILRIVEHPIKAMGMDSPHLLKLVESCPKGSETLVTRLIHILTDKAPPSPELVERVRELYQTRVSDVRFLIPVLNGLTKSEIIAALPKLIKLNPIVVKEVFNRLLGSQAGDNNYASPIAPSELLIALHVIDPAQCELKTVIKATSLCFNDKQAYTQEVLAVVMQQLMEVTPLPTLLMRTVIQALSLYPRLIGFVMNILQRLILKQVWRQKKVWEGFIKCCQRAQPHSFQVLLQLPAQQLKDVFTEAPDLRQPMLDHIMEFTENQRAHIPDSIMDVLNTPATPPPVFTIKDEPVSPPHKIMPSISINIKSEPYDESISSYSQPAPPGLE
ncbi:symplekin [Nesidiocoris tenuis]|uniref:Symplekin n=2 Tax=Nesidiocoris tenuis TaxID=355587 RepID=A0ABN7B8V8_9HEMI|nr:symplekin [Nesidiocoris tenuis]